VRELSDSRTFCRQADVDAMRANGLALGGNYENAVVVDGAKVLSPGGLRHADEPVRHKMLDALGDLALAGAPILGRYTGNRAGHAMTNRLLRALFARPSAVRMVLCSPETEGRLPGVGLNHTDYLAAV
jgi:UDP-3-O-[3-hydroxymyristoyl] N-acetylglucosamine deacetylase